MALSDSSSTGAFGSLLLDDDLSFAPGFGAGQGVRLGITSRGDYALKKGTDLLIPVTFGGQFASASKPGFGWSAVAATTSGNDYKLFWRNAGSFARWILDPTGALSSSSFLGEAELFHEESDANADLNGDGRIGIEYTSGTTTLGTVNLGANPLGYAIRKGAGAPIQVRFSGGNASANNPGSGWSAVAASDDSGSGFKLYWQNSSSGRFSRWRLDPSGALVSSSFLSEGELYSEESTLNHDLNRDDRIGLTYTPGTATLGAVNLGTNPLGYAISKGTGAPIQVRFSGGNASANNPGSGWSAVAASDDSGSGFKLYWQNSSSGRFSRWRLDPSGAMVSSSFLNEGELYFEESTLNHDLNRDDRIGLTYTPGTTTLGAVNLGANPLGYAIRNGTAAPIQVTFSGGNASANNPGSGWTAVAASAGSDSGFDLYWLNSTTNQIAKWEVGSSGALESSELMSQRNVYKAETRLAFDLDRDGITGLPYSGLATIRDTSLADSPVGYVILNGSDDPISVTDSSKEASADFPGGGWRAIAAAEVISRPGVAYQIYWFNDINKQYAMWSLNAGGASIGGTFLSKQDLLAEEVRTGFDLSDNGTIGSF